MDDRLYRSVDDRMLAGVAGGVAERLDADPSIIRVVWALLVVLTGGLALVAYVVMAIVVPEDPGGEPAWEPSSGTPPPAAGGPGAADGATAPDPDAPTAATPFLATAPVSSTATDPATSPASPAATSGAVGGWVAPNGQSVPRASSTAGTRRQRSGADRRDDRGPLIGGLVLILIGGFFLLRQFIPAIDLGSWWPIILVGIGAALVIMSVMPDRKSG